MERQTVYCEIEFYKRFLDSFPKQVLPSEDSLNRAKQWIDFSAFLFKSAIYIDINAEEFRKLSEQNEYYTFLWKKSVNGECFLEFQDSGFPYVRGIQTTGTKNNEILNAVFLTTESVEECQKLEKKFGIRVISDKNLFQNENLFITHIETINSGNNSHTNWDFLEVFSHPCNSIAIVDNYLLRNEAVIKENLIPILQKLIPPDLSIPFNLSIFTLKRFREGDKDVFIDFGQISKFILEELRKTRSEQFKINIGIFNSNSRDYHDRVIITNYMIIDSGSGFDLFKKYEMVDGSEKEVAIHQTKIIGYYPHFASNLDIKSKDQFVNIYSFHFNNMKSDYFKTKEWFANSQKPFHMVNRLFEN